MARCEVVEQHEVGRGLFSLTFTSPVDLTIPDAYVPGQFLHMRVSDSYDLLLRRPLSLCQVDVARGHLTVVYRAGGAGTKRLATLSAGDSLDVLGPLGHGFPVHATDQLALLIAGGIGVPPMVELARALDQSGVRVHAILGFQSADQVILVDELQQSGATVTVITDDGSSGREGLVTDLLSAQNCQDADRYYACGPTPMLRAVQARMTQIGIAGYLSLEERMGCGIGICAGCVHPILRGGQIRNQKTCREGPVFAASEVVFS